MTRSRERLVFLKTPKIVGWNFVEGSCSPFSHHRQAALAEMDLLLPFTTARKRERGKECLTFFRTQSGKWYVIQMCQEKEQKWEERRGEMRIHERESKLQSGVGGEKKKGDRMENVVQRTPCTLRMLKLLFTRYITCHYRTFMKGDDPDVW